MAAFDTGNGCYPDPDICKITNGWFLEYICKIVWQEFKETHQVKSASRDIIQGILNWNIVKTPHHECRIHFLLIMCKLVDGEAYGTQYTEESVHTVLEEVVVSFDALVQCMQGFPGILDTSAEYRKLILKQAVYVCCRSGDMEVAEEVVKRQWTDVDHSALGAQKEVLEVLQSKHDHHKALTRNSYDGFINKLIVFLDKLFNCLQEPYIFKVAKHFTPNPADDNDRQIFKSKYFKDGHKLQHHMKRKLDCIRKQMMPDLATFGTESSERLTQDGDCEENKNVSNKKKAKMSKRRSVSSLVRMVDKHRKNLKNATNNYSKHFPLTSRYQSPIEKRSNVRKEIVFDFPCSESELSDIECDKRPAHLVQIQGQHKIRSDLKYSPQQSTNYGIRVLWTKEEEDSFYLSVQKIGVGSWTAICSDLDTRRSISSLSHKWRQLETSGRIKELIEKHGPIKRSKLESNNAHRSPSPTPSTESEIVQNQNQHGIKSDLRYIPKYHATSNSMRTFWTEEEEDSFYLSVQKKGVGNWASICSYLKTSRTNKSLRDKWRNIQKSGRIKELTEKYGPVKTFQ